MVTAGTSQNHMAENNHSKDRTLEINKYPNRRYYDTTRSRNISLEHIHRAIIEGWNVRVLDAKTKQDITAQVLTQILLEYEPLKLSQFSNELLTQTIRVNDAVLKDFVDVYFRQAFEAFCVSQKQVDQFLRQTHQLQSMLPKPAAWAGNFFSPWMPAPAAPGVNPPASGAPAQPAGKDENKASRAAAGSGEIAALRKEIATLKAQLSGGRKRTDKRPRR